MVLAHELHMVFNLPTMVVPCKAILRIHHYPPHFTSDVKFVQQL